MALRVFQSASSASITATLLPPSIALIEPTPIKPPVFGRLANTVAANDTPTGKRQSQLFRLLYSGSLILEDEHTKFPLDGICFVAHFPPTSPTSLMSSPLPLALESMRGRPSLRVTSIIPLAGVQARLDDSVDIRLYWHPDAYFANEFFMKSVVSLKGFDEAGFAKQCVKVALGDEGSYEDELIIYGQTVASTKAVRFLVTRLLPVPVQLLPRPPRPDDPLPRCPTAVFASPGRKGVKRTLHASPDRDSDRQRKRGKVIPPLDFGQPSARNPFARSRTTPTITLGKGNRPATLAPSSRNPGAMSRASSVSSSVFDGDDVFKIPEPVTKRRRQDSSSSRKEDESREPSLLPAGEVSEVREANMKLIKKQTVARLATRGIQKDHPEFAEMYRRIREMVAFVLRKSINVRHVEREVIRLRVKDLVDMAVDDDE